MPAWLEGVGEINVSFEVTEIPKLLLSARQVARQGLWGWLGPDSGGLYNSAGEKVVHLHVFRDVYWIKLYLRADVDIGIQDTAAGKSTTESAAAVPPNPKPEQKPEVEKAVDAQKPIVKEAAMPQKPVSVFEYRGFPRRLS